MDKNEERRLFKDAHANHFAKVRHFPALHAPGQMISQHVVVTEEVEDMDQQPSPKTKKPYRGIGSRYAEDQSPYVRALNRVPSLTEFRSKVLCSHLKGHTGVPKKETSRRQSLNRPAFYPTNYAQAKNTIARTIHHDVQPMDRGDRILPKGVRILCQNM